MTTDRCPSCRGAVRAGDPWCTLCWTDLRPKPEPVPVPAPEPVVAAAVQTPVAVGAGPVVDPLTAPLGALLGQPLPGHAAAPGASVPVVTWPCVECDAKNAIDQNTCSVCTAPFGGRITRLDDPKGVRRRYMVIGLGAVCVFLMLLAAITFAATKTGDGGGGGEGPAGDPFAPTIDYSRLPQG